MMVQAVLRAVDMNGASSYLPRLWSDMLLFDQTTRETLVTQFIEALYKNPAENEKMAEKLADTAQSIYNRIEEQNSETNVRRSNALSWTGSMLGHLMGVLLHANQLEKACVILSKLDTEQQKILGVPDIRPLTLFVEKCIQSKDADKAIWCIQYCYDAGYDETNNLGQMIFNKLKFTDSQLNRLKTVVKLDLAAESAN